MSKQTLRAFSFGMLLSTLCLSAVYLSTDTNEQQVVTEVTEQEVSNFLKTNKLVAIPVDEYNTWQESLNKQENKNSKIKKEPEETVKIFSLKIEKGITATEIANQLENAKIISKSQEFLEYMNKGNLETKIQVGTFHFSSEMSIEEIVKLITKQ